METMAILQTTYEIKGASFRRSEIYLKTEKLSTARNFLKNKKVPFNFDIDVYNWDGLNWTINTYTGDQFLEDTKGI